MLWEPSVGWQPIGWEALQVSRPASITELQVRCQLTNHYFKVDAAEEVKQTHYELELQPDNSEFHQPIVAYVLKNSPAGQRIFKTLSDGKEHPLVLGIQFRDRRGEECAWVRHLASDRAYVFDSQMRQELTAPIDVAPSAEIGWAAFKASRPTNVTDLHCACKLTHNYAGFSTQESVKHTHYELSVRPDVSEYQPPLVAYVVKESPAGKRIYQVLSDGQERAIVVGVQFRDRPTEECVWVRELISDCGDVYDADMRRAYVSSVEAVQPQPGQIAEIPFELSEGSAKWVVNHDVLGDQVLIVPEARFRVTASFPITNLRIKLVYLLSLQNGNKEVLDEDTQSIVSASDRPLDKGFSKSVISKSGKGYKYKHDNAATIAGIVTGTDGEVEVYYDTGYGFTKLQSIPVTKKVGE